MSTTFQELMAQSGDSVLQSYEYRDGMLKVIIRMDLGCAVTVIMSIRTDTVRALVPTSTAIQDRTCYLDLLPLNTHIDINENGLFVPASSFDKLMPHVRNGTYLAYGRHSRAFPFLLRFVSSHPLLVCPISSLDDITWVINE